jgi:hypothetical protein
MLPGSEWFYFKRLFCGQAENPSNPKDVKSASSQRLGRLAKGATLCGGDLSGATPVHGRNDH